MRPYDIQKKWEDAVLSAYALSAEHGLRFRIYRGANSKLWHVMPTVRPSGYHGGAS